MRPSVTLYVLIWSSEKFAFDTPDLRHFILRGVVVTGLTSTCIDATSGKKISNRWTALCGDGTTVNKGNVRRPQDFERKTAPRQSWYRIEVTTDGRIPTDSHVDFKESDRQSPKRKREFTKLIRQRDCDLLTKKSTEQTNCEGFGYFVEINVPDLGL